MPEWKKSHRLKRTTPTFADIPTIFGTPQRTRMILALAVNGPANNTDLFEAVTTSYTGMYFQLDALRNLGIVVSAGHYRTRLHWLNRKHPCYPQFVAIAKLADARWPIPRWEKRRRPIGSSDLEASPVDPPCTLFYFEPMTRCLLYVCVAGVASLAEMSDMLGYSKGQSLTNGMQRLIKEGLLIAPPRLKYKDPRPWNLSLDKSHFAYRPLSRLLRRLAAQHPDIEQALDNARKYRKSKCFKKNWNEPHIHGARTKYR